MSAAGGGLDGERDGTAMTSSRGSRGGFTLIELMVVVFIIGILMGIGIPTWLTSRQIAQEAACSDNRTAADKWLQVYTTTEQRTPETLDELFDAGYMAPFQCPGGGTYELRLDPDAPEETTHYHPIPYLWCSVHGSEHEEEEAVDDDPEIEVAPDVELEPAPRRRLPF